MSTIRKNSLKAASWIYVGFLVGAVNQYFFTHKNWFQPEEYGLTRSLLDISILVSAISTLGTTSFLYKFFPYYKDNVQAAKNDMLALALRVALGGFAITAILLWLLQPLIIQKFGTNSHLLVEYFYYVLPFGGSILLYNILEAYAYGFDKGVYTSMLKELILRVFTSAIIILKIFDYIDFEQFILFFSLQYASIVIILAVDLYSKNQLWISFKTSNVTRKFRRKIIAILAFTFIVIIVNVLRQSIDSLVLAAKQDLAKVGIFSFASYLVSLMQAPFRSIIAVTIPVLSRYWKAKNVKEIKLIYQRSSINLLTFALFIFYCIWLNYTDAINFFNIDAEYLTGKWVFFILSIVAVIEMGTGVSGQIIGTSTYWRFELWTSLLLTCLIIPLSYILTVKYGILGPAIANLISFSVYNAIRMQFLWKKFHMQPFNTKTAEIIIISLLLYLVTYFAFNNLHGLSALLLRTIVFTILMATCIYFRNISPDVKPVFQSLMNRFKK